MPSFFAWFWCFSGLAAACCAAGLGFLSLIAQSLFDIESVYVKCRTLYVNTHKHAQYQLFDKIGQIGFDNVCPDTNSGFKKFLLQFFQLRLVYFL